MTRSSDRWKASTTELYGVELTRQWWWGNPKIMTPNNEKVRVQYEKFLGELPALKGRYAGRWVVYLDGVRSVHNDEREALRSAIAAFGSFGGFTVAQVVDPEPVLLTAALAYRVG